jgi:hypothetical protein
MSPDAPAKPIAYVSGYVGVENDVVHISYVNVDAKFRGKRLCTNILLRWTILLMNKMFNKRMSFYLENAGGEASCKCYMKSFLNANYVAFVDGINTNVLILIYVAKRMPTMICISSPMNQTTRRLADTMNLMHHQYTITRLCMGGGVVTPAVISFAKIG